MRWLLTVLAWTVSFAVLAPACFIGVMVLAGPHSSVLPAFLQPVVLVVGWVVILAAPMLIARTVWCRSGRSGSRRAL
jgi:hypothetical protein